MNINLTSEKPVFISAELIQAYKDFNIKSLFINVSEDKVHVGYDKGGDHFTYTLTKLKSGFYSLDYCCDGLRQHRMGAGNYSKVIEYVETKDEFARIAILTISHL